MNKKELKAIAEKIAKLEIKHQQTEDREARRFFEDEIFRLSNKVTTLDDMMYVDNLIQEIIDKQ